MGIIDEQVRARRAVDPEAWDELQRIRWGEDTDARWVKTEAGWVLNAEPVMYAGSQTECHGPAWVIGSCDCDDCLEAFPNPWERCRWVLGVRREAGTWLQITHVRETSFQDRVTADPAAKPASAEAAS